jgi:hypothetical protein
VVRANKPPRLKLYWYSTVDGDEDWFVVSRGAREARQWVAAAEGYGTGDVGVELIIPLPANLQGTGEGWPDKDVLLALGARFVRLETPRVVRIRSTNTVADESDGGCYLVWGCWSSEPRDARLKTLASSRC